MLSHVCGEILSSSHQELRKNCCTPTLGLTPPPIKIEGVGSSNYRVGPTARKQFIEQLVRYPRSYSDARYPHGLAWNLPDLYAAEKANSNRCSTLVCSSALTVNASTLLSRSSATLTHWLFPTGRATTVSPALVNLEHLQRYHAHADG